MKILYLAGWVVATAGIVLSTPLAVFGVIEPLIRCKLYQARFAGLIDGE